MVSLESSAATTVGIGLVFDMRNPAPWQRPPAELYGRTLDRIQEAERLGCASVWFSEHHLFDDGYLPQPLTMAAAAAARTDRIRIGTSICNAALRNPVDLAEQAAVVDILSGGRLELGLGAGYAASEFEAYGVEHAKRRAVLRNTVSALPQLWDGVVTPRPVQSPIPIWVAAMGPQMASFAGRAEVGLLLAEDPVVEAYTAALPDPALARCIDMTGLFIADDPERAWAEIEPHLEWIARSYAAAGGDAGTSLQIDLTRLRHREGVPPKPAIDVVTPDEAVARLRPWAASRPLVQMQFAADFAGLSDDLLDRHIELLGTCLVGAIGRSSHRSGRHAASE